MEDSNIGSQGKLSKLEFNPFTLRAEFYDKLASLGLSSYKSVYADKIYSVRKKMEARLSGQNT
jgi:hypothetical protein